MIVQCPQCRARFRVADEKVPDKGVKVRCTKCANVFRVTRADAAEKSPTPPPSAGGLGLALGLDAPRAPPPPPRAPAPAPAPDPFAELARKSDDPFADLDLGAPPPPAPPAPKAAPTPAPATVDDPFADAGDVAPPPSLPAAPTVPDPFAVGPSKLDETDPFAGVEHSLGPAPTPFSTPLPAPLPDRRTEPTPALDDLAGLGGAAGDFAFGGAPEAPSGLELGLAEPRGPAAAPVPIELGRFGQPEPEPPRELDPAAAARLKVRREVAQGVFNVLAALAIGLTGLVTAAMLRAPRPLTLDDLGFNIVWLALGTGDAHPNAGLVASNVRSGTYVTRGGHELFYVTGKAVNGTGAVLPAVHVQVDLKRGDDALGHAESVAGAAAGPEELYALDTGSNVELQRELARGVTNLRLPPRQSAPFIAVFPLAATEVEGAKVELTVDGGLPPTLQDAYAKKPAPAPPKPAPGPAPLNALAPATPPAPAKP